MKFVRDRENHKSGFSRKCRKQLNIDSKADSSLKISKSFGPFKTKPTAIKPSRPILNSRMEKFIVIKDKLIILIPLLKIPCIGEGEENGTVNVHNFNI